MLTPQVLDREGVLVQQDLAEGRSIRLGERIGNPEEICIGHTSGRLPSRRLRALIDGMVAFFAHEPLSGTGSRCQIACGHPKRG